MKKIILILITFFIVIFIIGSVLLNSYKFQDRLLNIGLNNLVNISESFLDNEDTLKVVVCGSRSPLPSPGTPLSH